MHSAMALQGAEDVMMGDAVAVPICRLALYMSVAWITELSHLITSYTRCGTKDHFFWVLAQHDATRNGDCVHLI